MITPLRLGHFLSTDPFLMRRQKREVVAVVMESVPKDVLKAFNCVGTPEKLQGGEGNSFVVENTVFKPVENIERYEWACEILLRIPQTGFRISIPRKSIQERFTYAGWGATNYEPGGPIHGRWEEKLFVCRAFHAALQGLSILPMPPSRDRWTQAHTIAWAALFRPMDVALFEREYENFVPLLQRLE